MGRLADCLAIISPTEARSGEWYECDGHCTPQRSQLAGTLLVVMFANCQRCFFFFRKTVRYSPVSSLSRLEGKSVCKNSISIIEPGARPFSIRSARNLATLRAKLTGSLPTMYLTASSFRTSSTSPTQTKSACCDRNGTSRGALIVPGYMPGNLAILE